MQIKTYQNFKEAVIEAGRRLLLYGSIQETEKWQGIKPPQKFWEVLNLSFSVILPENIFDIGTDLKPNQPWADAHFIERVSGEPVNPGNTYKLWPSYGRDKEMRTDEKFSHTYMERYWPKYAGEKPTTWGHSGIRYEYGDLQDVIDLLVKEPNTRQAYLPIFFPEDTGGKPGRVPCTLGYLFYIRNGYLHCQYYMRSCDYFRHFRDDLYLTSLLTDFVRDQVQSKSNHALKLQNGVLTTTIANLHCFELEKQKLEKLIYA